MTDQGGVAGVVLGVRDQLTGLFIGFQPSRFPFALIDIFLVATLLYLGYLLIKDTRAIRIFYGIVVLGLVYGLAQLFELVTLLFLIQSIFAVVLVAIPVVFQPELRAGLEKIGRTRYLGSSRFISGRDRHSLVQILAESATVLADKKIGALIVMERHDSLRDYELTGVPIGGELTSELLLTIFRPGSALHDGAVVLHSLSIVAASCLLPVAGERFDSSIGTRHRAAIGVTQDSDAIALVVSEETGRISIAEGGELIRNVRPNHLETKLATMLADRSSLAQPWRQR